MDEPIQRKHGIVTFEYINELTGWFPSVPNLTNEHLPYYDHRDYGMLFQTIAYALELVLGIDNSRDVFLLRHGLVIILFWSACMVFYLILVKRFNSHALAISGVLMLVLSPRIFGDSMYNPKDIPLLCWFIFAFYTHSRFIKKSDKYGPLIHGLTCALIIGSRIIGVIFPILSILYVLAYTATVQDRKEQFIKITYRICYFSLSLLLFTFFFWPVLWEDPIGNFIHSFNSMKRFRWNGEMLYMGQMIKSVELPWHYLPVWIAVTTPLTFLVLIFIGLFRAILTVLKEGLNYLKDQKNGPDILAIGLFITPSISIIILNSVLYNGWRHLYFIYPFLVYFGVYGLQLSISFLSSNFHGIVKQILIISTICFAFFNIVSTFLFLVKNHPHQSVYFNILAGNVESNFERDYYGVSYKMGLRKLLDLYPEKEIKIYSFDFIGKINTMNFPKKDADRLLFVENIENADFFITLYNFRSSWERQEFLARNFLFNRPSLFEIQVDNYKIFQVIELK